MNKRLLSYILILVMVFGATAPCYAEAWTSQQAYTVTQGVTSILGQLMNFSNEFAYWATLNSSGNNNSVTYRFQDLMLSILHIEDWLIPSGARPSNFLTMWDYVYGIAEFSMQIVSNSSNIYSSIVSWASSNNEYLLRLRNSLSNMYGLTNTFDVYQNAHSQIPFNPNANGWYSLINYDNNGSSHLNGNYFWGNGSPIGNIALMLWVLQDNLSKQYQYEWAANLTGYNATLGIWDSQQDSLTQETWVPQSAINGLYKYLAYLQRDVARMTFVLSSPEEQAAMENANESGVSALYGELYDDSNGGVTLSDMSDTFNTGKVAKQTFNSGVSFSTNGLFSFTDDEGWGFWSQAVMNDMDNVPQTRDTRMLKSSVQEPEYDMSAYEDRLNELLKIYIQGVVVDD